MPDDETWKIVHYRDARGHSPVLEFLQSLDTTTQRRIVAAIERLRVENQRATFPLVRKIDGKIWELRNETTTNIHRIFYFFFTGKNIVLLHAFQKKTQKTPSREIEIAQHRYRDFLQRMQEDDHE